MYDFRGKYLEMRINKCLCLIGLKGTISAHFFGNNED